MEAYFRTKKAVTRAATRRAGRIVRRERYCESLLFLVLFCAESIDVFDKRNQKKTHDFAAS